MGQKTDSSTPVSENVVSLFGKNKPMEKSEAPAEGEDTFEAELKKNRELAEKLKKERQKANQAVLRSYRLKT